MTSIEAKARALDPGLGWPKPGPILGATSPAPYPADALPEVMRSAVLEVQRFVQSPLPMVAGSALTALSVAIQAHANIQRAPRLIGPCSIYMLQIASSGERKSTNDGYFLDAVREWQSDQAKAMAPEIASHKAASTAHEIQHQELVARMKSAAKKKQDVSSLQRDLAELEMNAPIAPRMPRVLLGDETPEALAWGLARQWPSAAIISAEAGIVFGGHAMGSESIMRNLALLNVLWDGGEHSTGRRSKESFTVRNARLTVSLQVQPEALRQFFDKAGALARGSGFMARFLIAWPESTQGTRLYREPPDSWPALERFNARIRTLLDNVPEIDDDGGLVLPDLTLSPDAKQHWVEFHDAIESDLKDGGELRDVRDVASKVADNAARIACLFHVFQGGDGAVSLDAMRSAARIAAWHLNESRRFFDEIATPPRVQDAIALDAWMIDRCKTTGSVEIPRREIQRLVTPARLRQSMVLTDALGELEDLNRCRLVEDGRQKIVEVNPILIGGGQS